MYSHTCINHISNGLTKKMEDKLGLKNFSPNIIIGESIIICMWELNKVHDMGIQSIGNKENKGVVHNQLKSFINGNLLHPVHLAHFLCTVSEYPYIIA